MAEETNERNTSIPRGFKSEDSAARVEWVKEFTGIEIDNTPEDDPEDLKGIIENHVGFMKVPMAVVGPMLLDGVYAKGEFSVPLCTIEGTRSFNSTKRDRKLTLCIYSIKQHRTHNCHGHFHEPNMVFYNSF